MQGPRWAIALATVTGSLALGGCERGPTNAPEPAMEGVATTAASPSPSTPEDSAQTALEVLELAEAAHAGGRRIDAVALWRRAFLELPRAEDYDAVRHTLVLRISQALLELYEHDPDDYHLRAAQQMLDRWVGWTGARGDDDPAAAARLADAYALLGEVELRLEEPGRRGDADTLQSEGVRLRDHALQQLNERVLGTHVVRSESFGKDGSHRGESIGPDGMRRDVVVDGGSRTARLSDPRVERFLRHPDPEGASLFVGGDQPLNPTRPLVRFGPPKLDESPVDKRALARSESWRIAREARSELERCYAMSYARAPQPVVHQRLVLTADQASGLIVASLQGDELGDHAGDLCVVRVFTGVRVSDELAGGRLAEIPVTFFLQQEQRIGKPAVSGGPGMGAAIGEYDGDRREGVE